MRESPLDLEAGAARVLQLAEDTGGKTPEQLASAMATLMTDLDERRRASWLELPPHTIWRLIYEPMGIRFALDPLEVEWEFWKAGMTWTPEPGVEEVLRLLSELQIPHGVLSNAMFGSQTIARELAEHGLAKSFRWIMSSTDYVLRKPHPRLFELAAKRLGEKPGDVWFVGNSYEYDVCGAAAAGLVPVWYRAHGEEAEHLEPAAHVVPSWSEFHELLSTVLRRT